MQQHAIQQINLAYDQQQDRLLLKAAVSDAQEIRLWLSYRVARQMFKVLNREAHLPVSTLTLGDLAATPALESPIEARREFAQEADAVQQLAHLDFTTAYQPRPSTVGEAVLLVVNARFVSINDQLNHMQLACANGANVNMRLNHPLVLAMSRMLMVASQDAGWALPAHSPREPEAVSSIVMQVSKEKQVLH